MIKKLFLIIFLIIIILVLSIKIKIKSLRYNNYLLKGFLDDETIISMKNCFTLRDKKSINCTRKNQRKIFSNLKKKFNTNYKV